MKKLIVTLLAVAAVAAPAATAATGQRPAAADSSLVQTAIAVNSSGRYAGQFDTLICLVAHNPTVLSLLSQKGQYTVFAPTDAAFAQIGVTGSNCATVASTATNILAYHAAHGRRDAADVVSSTQIRMLNGQTTSLSAAGGSYYINNAKILVTDVFASNGVIHAIDHVLLPG